MFQINNVNTFIGCKKIIKNASFQVKPGSIVGLIGPNGAGKTTIMKTILGLTKFTGKVVVEGQPVTENNHKALRQVGALIEHPAIYPFLSGFQNLKLYSVDENDMNHVISMLEMSGYIRDKAKGYSMGMKQKLGIAIALLNHPRLIILDEPMNGLDIEATILIRKIIKQYAADGSAFLISSHVLGELQKIMTDVLLISEGEIIVDESIETFSQMSFTQYQLLTENMDATKKLLSENQIPVHHADDRLLISRDQSDRVQDLLWENHIHLEELTPKVMSFEQTIVNLLKKQ